MGSGRSFRLYFASLNEMTEANCPIYEQNAANESAAIMTTRIRASCREDEIINAFDAADGMNELATSAFTITYPPDVPKICWMSALA